MYTDMQCPGDGSCSNQGVCDVSIIGTCTCNLGFQGDMCQGENFRLLKFLNLKKGLFCLFTNVF